MLTVNAAAARLLKRTRYGATISDIAAGLGLSEERVLTLCEYFPRAGRRARRPAARPSEPRFRPLGHRHRPHPGSGRGPRPLPGGRSLSRLPRRAAGDDSGRRRLGRPGRGGGGRGGPRRPSARERPEPRPRLFAEQGRPRGRGRHPGLRRQRLRARPVVAARAHALLRLGQGGGRRGTHPRLLHRVAARPLRGGVVSARHGAAPDAEGPGPRYLLRAHLQPAGAPLHVRGARRAARRPARGRRRRPLLASPGRRRTTSFTPRRE